MAHVQAVAAEHEHSIREFFESVPPSDRTFFKEDITDLGLFGRWLSDTQNLRFLAVEDQAVVGYLAIIPGIGRMRGVSELRVVISATQRRHGIGSMLARHGLRRVVAHQGTHKAVVEVPVPLQDGVAMFTALGFEPEALLRDHIEDIDGNRHDLWILSYFVAENMASLEALGVSDFLSGTP
jgi:ribosomal protein S18 acetylase RimI-like enzyme